MRKSIIPVIAIAVIVVFCLSIAFAIDDNQTGEMKANPQFGDSVTFYNVTGTVTCNSSPIEDATIVLTSENMTVNGTTDSSGKFSLAVIPDTYELTVSKLGYVTFTHDVPVTTSDVDVPVSITEKTAVNGSTITGYVMSLDDFVRYEGSTVDIKLYYRTTETESTLFSDYAEMQYTSAIDVSNGTFKIVNVKYDGGTYKDTLVDRCYIKFSVSTYSVANVSSTCITDKITFTDSSGVKTTLYHLNKDISSTGSFEDNGSYTLGSSISACAIFEPAIGTISGSMNASGTVTVKDSNGNVMGEGATDSSGNYSFTSYVGKDLNLVYTAVGYQSKTVTATVYDDNVDPLKNKQSDVTLTKMEIGTFTVKFYVDGKTGRIDDISPVKSTLYYLKNPNETDPSKRVYDALATTDTLVTDTDKDKVNGYYFSFTIEGTDIECARCFFNVDISGYSVRMVQSEFMEKTATLIENGEISTYRLKSTVSSTEKFEAGKKYSVGTGSSDAILIDSATGTVTGDVMTNTENPSILNGVKVSILNSDNTVVAYGITYNKGNYSIKVPIGEYKITYEIEGYVTYESTVKVYDETIYDPSKNTQPTVKLDAAKGEFFGMDLPHALLAIGGVIAVLLICVVIYHRFRILGKKKNVIIEDDDEKD